MKRDVNGRLLGNDDKPQYPDEDAPTPRDVLALDDPRIEPLRARIHEARGHDWQPPCGSCFDEAYRYIGTSDLLALTRREPLDVERLARALESCRWAWLSWTDNREGDSDRRHSAFHNAASAVAAEYARLEAADKT